MSSPGISPVAASSPSPPTNQNQATSSSPTADANNPSTNLSQAATAAQTNNGLFFASPGQGLLVNKTI